MTVETRYFCIGGCGAVITQQQYGEGLTKYGTVSCNMHDKLFEKGFFALIVRKE